MMMLRMDDPPEEIAERAKQKGNYFLKKGLSKPNPMP
jgi:hypothetical protein